MEIIKRTEYRRDWSKSRKIAARRGKILGITESELLNKSLPEIKLLAKKNFRELSFRFHPDVKIGKGNGRIGRERNGFNFRKIKDACQWFQELEERAPEKKYHDHYPLPWHYKGE